MTVMMTMVAHHGVCGRNRTGQDDERERGDNEVANLHKISLTKLIDG